MHVMIVGARGQLGRDLAQEFSDCQVTLYDSEDMDIADEAKVQQQVSFIGPDLIINSAAFTRVDDCEREHLRAFEINALGPLHLALACKRWNVPLIHISTNYVFDGEKGSSYNENDSARPINSYGITKRAGEEYVQYTWADSAIVRVSGLFGLSPSRMKGTNFVEAMLRLGKKGAPLRIVSDEYVSPTFTQDAAKQVRRLVEREDRGVFHLSNQGQCSWLEFAQEIFNGAGMTVGVEAVTAEQYGAPAKRPPNSSLDNQRFRALGYPDMRCWKQALADYLAQRAKQETVS